MTAKKKKYTKIALALSLCLLILWSVMGTGTSLAWFTDTTPVQKNVFNIGQMNLVVSHRLEDKVTYKPIKNDTAVFDDKALYEPGYVQVVYLKVENKGNVAFDYKTAVQVTDFLPATNVFGNTFHLQEYLRFGLLMADTEAELEAKLATRAQAKSYADLDMPLSTYHSDTGSLNPGEEDYLAIIVRMPEEVTNVANYRKNPQPFVELGIIVKATQKGTPLS